MAVREVLHYPTRSLKQVCPPAQGPDIERSPPTSWTRCALRATASGSRRRRSATWSGSASSTSAAIRRRTSDNGRLVLVNPRIDPTEGSDVAREGCLSLPDLTANVRSATKIGVEHAAGGLECEGFEARCIQHEIDHLDGILFLDRVESLVDDVFRRKSYG